MQIIIPMSGFGERFRKAGYKVPKPLIELEGKPIIAHVIEMFPFESDFIFICNQDHLDNQEYQIEATIKNFCPSGKIVSIPAHKLGPVHAVMIAIDHINLERPVVVNYCDFTCYWDWLDFKDMVKETDCDGAIPAYKGFHPHSLGSTNYAYLKEKDGWAHDIQEKEPYTNNRMEEYASSGTYYFKTGSLMYKEMQYMVKEKLTVGGEYYVSLAYKRLMTEYGRVAVYPLQHFMQWGTPQDVSEYRYWSRAFSSYQIKTTLNRTTSGLGTVVLPSAGLGSRFSREGWSTPKPLIEVAGTPMIIKAATDLPLASNYVFVVRDDMKGMNQVIKTLGDVFPSCIIKKITSVTEGQACTVKLGLAELISSNKFDGGPVTVGACDNGALYDTEKLTSLMKSSDYDVIVWGVRGYPNASRHPEMYGWIDSDGDQIKGISVKTPLSNPDDDPLVLGAFTFKKVSDLDRSIDSLIKRGGKINGEYYMDSVINDAIELGLKCVLFEVDSYLCWGTPNDLKTYEYWQSCFHKWSGHNYQLDFDDRVDPSKLGLLKDKYKNIKPSWPI